MVDDFGLNWYHYGARWYDPQLGRWTTMDPADEFHSPYIYVGNDPVNLMDPDGRQIESASSSSSSSPSWNITSWFYGIMGWDQNSPKPQMKSEEQVEIERGSNPLGMSKQEMEMFAFAVEEDFVVTLANAEARAISTTLSLSALGAPSATFSSYMMIGKSASFNAVCDLTSYAATGEFNFENTRAGLTFGALSQIPQLGSGPAASIFTPNRVFGVGGVLQSAFAPDMLKNPKK